MSFDFSDLPLPTTINGQNQNSSRLSSISWQNEQLMLKRTFFQAHNGESLHNNTLSAAEVHIQAP
jgi:hypothetical protein